MWLHFEWARVSLCLVKLCANYRQRSIALSPYHQYRKIKETASLAQCSLGPRPKTNPSADCFQYHACYTGIDVCAKWGLGTRLYTCTVITSFLPKCDSAHAYSATQAIPSLQEASCDYVSYNDSTTRKPPYRWFAGHGLGHGLGTKYSLLEGNRQNTMQLKATYRKASYIATSQSEKWERV